MKYYSTLVGIYLLLSAGDLFLSRLFMHANFSMTLAFILTIAFIAPQKTRFIYRSIFPVFLVCGLAAENLSALPTGLVFLAYSFMTLIAVGLSKNIPRTDNLGALLAFVFCASLFFQFVFGVFANRFSGGLMVALIFPALKTAFFTAGSGLLLVVLLETAFGRTLEKILFNEN